jgi:hypothetical protein
MKRNSYIQDNFMNIVIIVLIVVLLLQRCGGGNSETTPTVIVKRDTTWIVKDSTIITKPQLVETIEVPIERWSTEYLPDTNYAKLLEQYVALSSKFLQMGIYQDTVKLDSFGYVAIKDTVTKNALSGRLVDYHIKVPKITETITVHEKKRNQVYIGGSIIGSPMPNGIMGGFMVKTKKDKLFGGSVGVNSFGDLQYGIHSYWKIKLKK